MEYAGFPGMYRVSDYREPEHGHLPIAIWTTANSRALLLDYGENTRGLAYWDTDGFFGDYRGESSKELGKLKHEYDYTDGIFLRPKLYSVLREIPRKPIVKAKGFPRLDRDQFLALANGGTVGVRLFEGIKTALSADAPSERNLHKGLFRICPSCQSAVGESCPAHPDVHPEASFRSRPKRRYGAESSAPWSYDDLAERWDPAESPSLAL
jgi:hypothetical protein